MLEEIASGAAEMLIFLFLIMVALVVVWGWMLFRGRNKMARTSKRKPEDEKYYSSDKMEEKLKKNHSSSKEYTIFHALFEALKEEDTKHQKR